jgi:exonuclease III
VISEISKTNLDIIVLSETKKKGFQEKIGNCVHIWSRVHKHQHARSGVSILVKSKLKKYVLPTSQ